MKENLQKVLGAFGSINPKNINLPILKNILISAEEHGVKLIATNLEIAIKALIRGKVEEKGDFTVPLKLFSDYIALIEEEKTNFELKNNELKISGDSFETRIKGMNANEFPVVPDIEEKHTFKISSTDLYDALKKVTFAVSVNELRPEIGGILFKFSSDDEFLDNKPTLTVVGTDSFRLSEKKLILDEIKQNIEVIIPLKTLIELQKILGIEEDLNTDQTIDIVIGNNQILFKYANIELISRVIEGTYPNYTQIIPKSFLTKTIVQKDQLFKTAKTSSLFSKSGIFDITLSFEGGAAGKLIISSEDANTGAYNSSIPANISGNSNKSVLNYKFLLEGIAALESKYIVIQMIDGASPVLFENYYEKEEGKSQNNEKKHVYLIMPIRQ